MTLGGRHGYLRADGVRLAGEAQLKTLTTLAGLQSWQKQTALK